MAQREITAIMFTDLVGYSALTQRNEALALELLETHWTLLRPIIEKFGGYEIKTMGDAFLIEFPSALQSVEAGLAMQATLVDYNDRVDKDHAIHIRVGIHTGDVERRGDDVFGDVVNIASRLGPLARPDGVCISEPVYASVQNKIDMPFYTLGSQRLKNISQPIAVYSNHPADKARFIKSRRYSLIAGFTIAAVVVIGVLITFTWIKEEPPVTTTTEIQTVGKDEPVAGADRKSLAVLPFANRSKSEDDTYFTDGLHDDLLTHLTKISDMKVISRTSVMQYRDTQKTIKTIGNELGVATLLEGSVQRAGNQVRINVQLINADTDEHLWAESYDRELTAVNIFAIQSEIARAIASALRATLSPEEQEHLAAVPTKNLAAYDSYLKGRHEQQKLTREGFANAIPYYEAAIKLDPNFAEAHERLGWVYVYIGTAYGWMLPKEAYGKAKQYAVKAIELKPEMGRSHELLASILYYYDWNVKAAEPVFKRAVELSPKDSSVYTGYAYFLSSQKRHTEAITNVETAIQLDPHNKAIYTNAAWRFMNAWDFNRAIDMAEKAYSIDPEFKEAQRLLGWGFANSGDYDSALRWFTVYGSNFNIAYINGLMGRHDVAMAEIQRRQKLAKIEYVNPASLALLYVSVGNFDQAFEWLEKGINERQRGLLFLDVSKQWEILREDPRFEAMVAKIKSHSMKSPKL